MSDLFHQQVPEPYIHRVFDVIADTPQHQYQVLTKRSRRLADVGQRLEWPPNLWIGVSVENARYRFRLDHLRRVEPLCGSSARSRFWGLSQSLILPGSTG